MKKKKKKVGFGEEKYIGIFVDVGREFALLSSFGRERRKVKILRRRGGGGGSEVNSLVHGECDSLSWFLYLGFSL